MTQLSATNINKTYNNQSVIKNFNFHLDGGEVVILLGESGTGKTTFMRMLNNLVQPDSGTIRIGDDKLCEDYNGKLVYSDKKHQRKYQRRLGMVFQDYQLFPNLTVRDNLMEAPLAQKLAERQALSQKAEQLLSQVGLANKADVYPSTLSGGQKQRVAIARALMVDPDFICFDEPTSALDHEAALTVGELITDLKKAGKGILVVTHDNEFAKTFGTRIVLTEEFLPQH